MSNYLAIATATEVLRSLLDTATAAAVPEVQVDVTTVRPDEIDDDGRGHVNVFLFQVRPHPGLRNQPMPIRRGDGALIQTPKAALTLNYLLTFSGDTSRQVAERLLGAAVAELESRPVLNRQLIRDVIQTQQAFKPFLAQSDLADEVELVKLSQMPLDLEELSKLWSVFFQVPYSLSVVYEASVVLLEPEGAAPQQALPVHGPVPPEDRDGRNLYVDPFRQPWIEALVPQNGAGNPVVAGDTLLIRGQRLRGELTGVAVGGQELDPAPADPGETEIELPLTTPPVPAVALRAGVVGVQVVHQRLLGTPPTPHKGVESNVEPFVLRPRITAVAVNNVQITPDDTRSAEVVVDFDPPVGKRQRVMLLLNELVPPSPPAPTPTRPPRAYSFEAPSQDNEAEPESRTQLTFDIQRVRPAEYLVRVQVDGAVSSLTLGSLPATPTIQQYVEPRITIP